VPWRQAPRGSDERVELGPDEVVVLADQVDEDVVKCVGTAERAHRWLTTELPSDAISVVACQRTDDNTKVNQLMTQPNVQEQLLDALVAVRQLRARLDEWEPQLISAARDAGVSWARLAPVLGLASRQAAERRFLRLDSPNAAGGDTVSRDGRVQAVRDRRAAERAVTRWARRNGADLRQLAGQIGALTDLGSGAQASLDELHQALGGDDAATLLPLLAATHQHLPPQHAKLAAQVAAVGSDAEKIRRDTRQRRSTGPRRGPGQVAPPPTG
jgi:hypothetical protein